MTCADVHPSYAYQLDNAGGFAPPPAASFDVHVERNAVVWAFFREGRARRLSPKELQDSEIRLTLRQQIASQREIGIIAEASDEHLRYRGNKDQVVVENLGTLLGVSELLPSPPREFPPQHNATPFALRAQV